MTNMKTMLSMLTIAFTVTSFGQKKMIPDLIKETDRVPVILDVPSFGKSGVFLLHEVRPDLLDPKEQYDEKEFQELPEVTASAQKVVEALNKEFKTDKFYLQPLEDLFKKGTEIIDWNSHNISFFVALYIRLDYMYVAYADKMDKYDIYKKAHLSYRQVSGNEDKNINALSLIYDNPASFYAEEELRTLEDFQAEYPIQNYQQEMDQNITSKVADRVAKIMKKYNKKKNKS